MLRLGGAFALTRGDPDTEEGGRLLRLMYICICLRVCAPMFMFSLCMHRTYILSRRQAYQHTQDMRFSSSGFGGRTPRPTTAVSCVGDSKTSRPARPPPIAGPLAVVGGVVTVRGRLPVTVPRAEVRIAHVGACSSRQTCVWVVGRALECLVHSNATIYIAHCYPLALPLLVLGN